MQQQQQQQQMQINATGTNNSAQRRMNYVLAHIGQELNQKSMLDCMPTASASSATIHPASFNTNTTKDHQTKRPFRHVIVDGSRTPFVKSFGQMKTASAIDLSVACIKHLVAKTKLDSQEIDQVIMGNVVLNSAAPNLARESVLDAQLPKRIVGTTISIACLSGLEAVHLACQALDSDPSLNVNLAAHCLKSARLKCLA
jgi:hypothetical protein